MQLVLPAAYSLGATGITRTLEATESAPPVVSGVGRGKSIT